MDSPEILMPVSANSITHAMPSSNPYIPVGASLASSRKCEDSKQHYSFLGIPSLRSPIYSQA